MPVLMNLQRQVASKRLPAAQEGPTKLAIAAGGGCITCGLAPESNWDVRQAVLLTQKFTPPWIKGPFNSVLLVNPAWL
jgi:hypothetical protein